MSVTTESVTRRDVETVWNSGGNLDEIGDIVTNDFVYHNPMVSEDVHGSDGYRKLAEQFRTAFSNLDMEIDELVTQDDRVAVRYTTRATHVGEIMGIEPTNRDIEVTGTLIDHAEDGKIKERFVNDGALGLLAQLGAAELPEELATNR